MSPEPRSSPILPEGLTAIHCPRCGRMGGYRRETLLKRFGPDAPLPHVLNLLADYPRSRDMNDPYGVVFRGPLGKNA